MSEDDFEPDFSVTKVQKSFALLQVEDSGPEEEQNDGDNNSDSDSKPTKTDNKKKSNSGESRTKEQGGKRERKPVENVMTVMKILRKY